jgi:hypothetical protein
LFTKQRTFAAFHCTVHPPTQRRIVCIRDEYQPIRFFGEKLLSQRPKKQANFDAFLETPFPEANTHRKAG